MESRRLISYHDRVGGWLLIGQPTSIGTARPGNNVPCELRFLVDPNSSYTCEADEEAQLLSLHILDSENYLGATASEADCRESATVFTVGIPKSRSEMTHPEKVLEDPS